MYGKRLTAQNYTDLLACRSVNEAAAYLKAHTVYADAFEGVTMGSLRRWQIEILLREHLSNNFASLCRYEKSIGDGFYKYFVTLSDVDMLLHSVRYLDILGIRIERVHRVKLLAFLALVVLFDERLRLRVEIFVERQLHGEIIGSAVGTDRGKRGKNRFIR